MLRKQKRLWGGAGASKRLSGSRLSVETLEDRRLLAGDILAAYEPQHIVDPFAYQAVTYDQMVARAAEYSYVEGELVVAVDVPLGRAASDAYLSHLDWQALTGSAGAQPMNTLMTAAQAAVGVSLVQINVGEGNMFDVMQQLHDSDGVRWAAPNFQSDLEDPRDLIPNDPQFGNQYHHPLIGNIDAWDVTLGDPSIVIGITDDGVAINHEDLTDAIWVNGGEVPGNGIDDDANGYVDDVNGYNFLNGNNNPDGLPGDDHGTHVAGIAAAGTNNGIGTSGTAGGATILPLKWYDGGTWTAAIIGETFTYAADNGADIVNTSYNMDGWVGDPTVTAGYQYMLDNGILHFNSAGNGSQANPPRQAFEQTLLTVSTESNDTKSGFSNWGTGVDISAPGGSILSTELNNTYGTKSGTSMAAPNAAGVAALVWSQNPTWTNYQVAAQVLATADNIDAANPGLAGLLGAGRVNSNRAVTETVAAPQLESFVGLPADGEETQDLTINGFTVAFDQLMDPATANDGANYELVEAGVDGTFGTADDQLITVSPASQYMIGSNGMSFNIDQGALGLGDYRMTIVSGGLANPFGTALDGNGDGVGGDNVVSFFSIVPEPPRAIAPLGSLIYEQQLPDAIGSAGDMDAFEFELDAGQTLTVVVDGDPTLVPTIDVAGPGGNNLVSVVGTGSTAIAQVIDVDVAGAYSIDIGGDNNTEGAYQLSLYLNAAVENEEFGGPVNDTMAEAENIDNSDVRLGDAGADRLAVLGRLPSSDGMPVITEDFESGSFGPQWTTSSTSPLGRIQITGQFGSGGGNLAMLMDVSQDQNPNLNEAIWDVDLTGLNSPRLSFYHAEFADELDSLPSTFTGSFNGDGVAISGDGTNWFTIYNPASQANGSWERQSINLANEAMNAGIPLGPMQIKFQQFDNFALDTDGRGYDEITISVPAMADDWYQFSLADGQSASIAATAYSGAGNVDVELYDAGGALLASGNGADNLNSVINQFVDTTSDGQLDDYFVRVAGEDVAYSLIVTRGADFDTESNEVTEAAQDITGTGGVLGHVSTSSSAVAEPDDYPAGDDISDGFDGVALSNNGTGSVFAASASFGAPTGQNVFAPTPTGASGWQEGSNELRADFDSPISFVSIDVGSDDSSDVGYLRAFDSNGTLLAQVVSGSVTTGNSQTLAISRGSAEIAYVTAAGVGTDITPLDNLVYQKQGSDDFYRLTASAGQMINLTATLPGAGPFLFENGLDTPNGSALRMELSDPNGNVVAMDDAAISYEATMAGDHQLRVFADEGGGEYFIQNGLGMIPSGDFNDDGNWDCVDADLIVGHIAGGGNDLAFDMDGNGVVNLDDVHEWLAVAGNINIGSPYGVADMNLDGVTDGADFIVWNDNKFSATGAWCSGDVNADGFTDGVDFIIWTNNNDLSPAPLVPTNTDAREEVQVAVQSRIVDQAVAELPKAAAEVTVAERTAVAQVDLSSKARRAEVQAKQDEASLIDEVFSVWNA